MLYQTFKDKKLAALGFGLMRLPTTGEWLTTPINEPAAAEMIDYAVKSGINYFDTAWGYHNGQSEVVLGKAMAKYPRESWYLADKFPGYDLANMDKVEEIFEAQLKRCGVEYFDFYLIHNVCERNIDAYLDPKYGIRKYVVKQKETGRIRHLGFSAHASYDVMKRFLESYGTDMEFCQIQLNYIDWEFQDAKGKLELLKEYQLPVWVMEPMRGGKLASLPEEYAAKLKALRPAETIPAWAFRFLQSIPGVTMTLTGSSTLQQLKDNIETYQASQPLNKEEMDTLLSIAADMLKKTVLPCTACKYCIEHCPQGLDIPVLLNLYNEHCFTGGGFLVPMALSAFPEEKKPQACAACKSCEEVCPQQLKIADALADFTAKLA